MFSKYLVLIILVSVLSGCCSSVFNSLANEKKGFESDRNREIGDPIESHFPLQIVQVIKEWDGIYGENIVVTRNENGTVTYSEPMTDSEQCVISRIIDEEGWIIRSWMYADGNDDCKSGGLYCGP